MILKFLKKVPAGMMVVPMFLSAIINTYFPDLLSIGSFTTALFTKQGIAPIMAAQLFCLGAQLQIKDLLAVVRRSGVLLVSKFIVGAIIGYTLWNFFGPVAFLGIITLACICAVTNGNGSLYLACMTVYGDEIDQAGMSVLALSDGPFLTLIILGVGGMANIPLSALVAVVVPILIGMLLGNLDKSLAGFLAPGVNILLPFVGITLGGSIDINGIFAAGMPGIIVAAIELCIATPIILLVDRLVNRRPGYAGIAACATAGNAIAVPAAVGLVDSSWAPYVGIATTQVAASTVITAICIPFLVGWWAKKKGCPKLEKISLENVVTADKKCLCER